MVILLMMNNPSENMIANFNHPNWDLFRDESGNLVPLTSSGAHSGGTFLLAHKQLSSVFAQGQFESNDADAQSNCSKMWSAISQTQFGLIQKIHEVGVIDSHLFCITEIPEAEQIQSFINRTGAMQTETAVAIILKFVRALRQQKLKLYKQYVLSPQCIWIRQGKAPELCFGEICGTEQPEALSHNIRLLVDLLGFLTDGDRATDFHTLCSRVAEASDFVEVENLLSEYLSQFASFYPSSYNRPDSLLYEVTNRYSESKVAKEDGIDIAETAKKAVWPVTVALVLSIVAMILYSTVSLPEIPSFVDKINEIVPTEELLAESDVPSFTEFESALSKQLRSDAPIEQ